MCLLLELERFVGRIDLPASREELARFLCSCERVRRLRRGEQRRGPVQRHIAPVRDQRPSRKRLAMLSQIGGKRRNLLVQRQCLRVEGVTLVGDACEEAEPFEAEELSVRRAGKSQGEVERRQTRPPPVLERLAE